MDGRRASGLTQQPQPRRRRLRHQLTPTKLTIALSTTLALLGAGLAFRTPGQTLLTGPSGDRLLWLCAALCLAFIGTEFAQAFIEVRSQAYSFSLSGVPLLIGLLYVPPHLLLPLRLGATVLVFIIQRSSGLKFAYNTAAFLLDTALVITVAHLLLGSHATALTLRTAGLCYLALAVVDVAMSSLVLLVIRINQGPLSCVEAAEVLLPASLFVALNTAIALTCLLLVQAGDLGVLLFVVFALLTVASYRAYLVLRRRHQSLRVVQDFIRRGEAAESVQQLCVELSAEARQVLRAERLEFTLFPQEHGIGRATNGFRIRVSDEGITVTAATERSVDWLPRSALRRGVASLVSEKAKEPGHRQWLAEQSICDALIAPLDGSNAVMVALDRLGDATRFTKDDLALLVTLTGHFGVALESRKLVERLQHEANHDVLTDLPNRALLTTRVRAMLDELVPEAPPAVLLLDLNRFKEVNDALGHHIGDQLLRVVGDRLTQLALADATVARLGGDEFAVLLPPCTVPDERAISLAQSICEALAVPVDLADVTITTEACIGIAVAKDGESHTDLMRHADTAMYAAKGSGIPWEIYSPQLDRGRTERLALVSDLQHAIDGDELHVHYQPKLDLESGLISSVEALVRWTHPTLGPLGPDVFIPLAESTGLIEQLTAVVLDIALRQCRVWERQGLNLAVAVNLSARSLNNPDLPAQVALALKKAGVSSGHLVLEITESAMMGDPERTIPALNQLASLGVTLSLDDFGTGYSSLAYLQRLPVREVKIDRSFVLGMNHPVEGRTSTALVRTIVSLGQSLGLRIVAEGIESEASLTAVRALGCHVVQGYYIGRPVPGHEIAEQHGHRLGDCIREGVRSSRPG